MESKGDWRQYGASALPRVLEAALAEFAQRGYHGTTIRDIAARAGLSVPGLYHHFRSKQDILIALMIAVMRDLIGRSELALATAPPDPVSRFDALVECMLRFHMFRREHAFVASSEVRSLDPEHRSTYVAMRDHQQDLITAAVQSGCETGVFGTPYVRDAARNVAVLCVGVATWYRPDGPLSPDELVTRHIGFARGLVGCPGVAG